MFLFWTFCGSFKLGYDKLESSWTLGDMDKLVRVCGSVINYWSDDYESFVDVDYYFGVTTANRRISLGEG